MYPAFLELTVEATYPEDEAVGMLIIHIFTYASGTIHMQADWLLAKEAQPYAISGRNVRIS